MKKLMALIALVAMVAVSSVTYAASTGTVTVSGTVGSILTVNNCNSGSDWDILVGQQTSDTCSATYSSNQAAGYKLTFVAADAKLVSGTNSIDAITTPAATCTAQAAECTSYIFNTTEAAGTYNIGGLNGAVNANQDDIPTTNFDVYNSVANDVADAETYTFTFYAWAENTTEAGVYSLDTGSLTVASI